MSSLEAENISPAENQSVAEVQLAPECQEVVAQTVWETLQRNWQELCDVMRMIAGIEPNEECGPEGKVLFFKIFFARMFYGKVPVVKLRTMVVDAEKGYKSAAANMDAKGQIENDPRVPNWFYHFLRKTKFDEAPQLLAYFAQLLNGKGGIAGIGNRALSEKRLELVNHDEKTRDRIRNLPAALVPMLLFLPENATKDHTRRVERKVVAAQRKMGPRMASIYFAWRILTGNGCLLNEKEQKELRVGV